MPTDLESSTTMGVSRSGITTRLIALLFAGSLAALAGCANNHTAIRATPAESARVRTMTAPPDKAVLYVYQDPEYRHPSCDEQVFLNRQSVGVVGPDTFLAVELPPGTYSMDLDLREGGTCASQGLDSQQIGHIPLDLMVAAGERDYVKVSFKINKLNLLFAALTGGMGSAGGVSKSVAVNKNVRVSVGTGGGSTALPGAGVADLVPEQVSLGEGGAALGPLTLTTYLALAGLGPLQPAAPGAPTPAVAMVQPPSTAPGAPPAAAATPPASSLRIAVMPAKLTGPVGTRFANWWTPSLHTAIGTHPALQVVYSYQPENLGGEALGSSFNPGDMWSFWAQKPATDAIVAWGQRQGVDGIVLLRLNDPGGGGTKSYGAYAVNVHSGQVTQQEGSYQFIGGPETLRAAVDRMLDAYVASAEVKR